MQEFKMEMSKYAMEVLTKTNNMDKVMSFVELCIGDIGDSRTSLQLTLVGEELAYNIFKYAYDGAPGEFILKICLYPEEQKVVMEFRDAGKPYNPLEHQDPDLKMHISEREIGGLGIILSKKLTDKQVYHYENGQNVLTIEKYVDINNLQG